MQKVICLLLLLVSASNLFAAGSEKTLMKKLKSIRIKHIEYQDAAIDDVIGDLQKRVKKLDPSGKGVNMIVAVIKGKTAKDFKVNLNLENIPLYNALDYITKSANMQFFLKENTVVVASKEIAKEGMEIRIYKVKPHVVSTLKRIYPEAKINEKKRKNDGLDGFGEDKDVFK